MKFKVKIILIILISLTLIGIFVLGNKNEAKDKQDKADNSAIIDALGDISVNYPLGKIIKASNLSSQTTLSKEFVVTNNGSQTAYYSIGIMSIATDISDLDKLSLSITSDNNGGHVERVKIPANDENIIDSIAIEAKATQRYKIKIEYLGQETEKSFKGELYVVLDHQRENSFAELILQNNIVNDPQTVPGAAIATAPEGLIADKDDYGKTYYFRGNVENNYVLFADKMWRIVRINGNGTVKLILDGSISNQTAAYNLNQDKTLSDYLPLGNYENSNLSLVLNNWYNLNLYNYDTIISNTKYCLDYASQLTEAGNQYYNAYVRININHNPSFRCIESSASLKVGLLTIDEVVFAGANQDEANNSYYLYNPTITNNWWTLSPYMANLSKKSVTIYTVKPNGSINGLAKIESLLLIRPTISLSNLAIVTGTGLKDNPYVVTFSQQ